MKCPQCGHEQPSSVECERCGIIFSKWKPHESALPEESAQPNDLPSPLETIFGDLNVLRLLESPLPKLAMLFDWPVGREFDLVDPVGRQRASIAQQRSARGFLTRHFALVAYPTNEVAATFYRPGWAYTPTMIDGARGERLGSVQRRFSIVRRYYDLRDASGRTFGTATGSMVHRGQFDLVDLAGQQRGEISRQWAGYTQEVNEARRFKIDFMNHHWTLMQRVVILAAAVAIDFDVFEGRENKIGIIALGD